MKRVLSLFFAVCFILAAAAMPASAASAYTDVNGELLVSAEGDTVTLFGSMDMPSIRRMWFSCSDGVNHGSFDQVIINVVSGEFFKVEIDASAVNSRLDSKAVIDIFCNTDDTDSFHLYKTVNITKAGEELLLDLSEPAGSKAVVVLSAESSLFDSGYTYVTAELPENITSLTSSYNEDNYVNVTVDGTTAIISGELNYDGLTGLWARCERDVLVGNGKTDIYTELASGEYFKLTVDLANVKTETFIDILPAVNDSNYFKYFHYDTFRIKPTEAGFELSAPPFTDHNFVMLNKWINPADTFDAKITEAVKAKSDEICEGITTDYEKLWALHTWVASNIYFDYDTYANGTYNVMKTPDEVLSDKRGVCDGYSYLLEALIEAQGIPAIVTENYAEGKSDDLDFWYLDRIPNETNHSHTEAFVCGRWVIMDSTWDSNNRYENGEYKKEAPTGYEYFDACPATFSADHIIINRYFERDISDIPSEWAKDEVFVALAVKTVPTLLQKDYKTTATRADFCKLLLEASRVAGIEIPTDITLTFSDTDDPEILTAASLGVILGYPDGTFKPDKYISREEAAVMLARAAKLFSVEGGTEPIEFRDMDKAADWAAPSIDVVSAIVSPNNRRVMGGVGDRNFDPKGSYTREAAILTVVRLLDCKCYLDLYR